MSSFFLDDFTYHVVFCFFFLNTRHELTTGTDSVNAEVIEPKRRYSTPIVPNGTHRILQKHIVYFLVTPS